MVVAYCVVACRNPCPNEIAAAGAAPGANGVDAPAVVAGYDSRAVKVVPSARATVAVRTPTANGPAAA